MMGRPITMDQLRQDVGPMVERITKVITSFRNFRLTMQEYVCLKVVAMLSNAEGNSPNTVIKEPYPNSLIYSGNVQDRELEQIHSRYMNCLRTFIEYNYPQEPNRVQELLVKLPEVSSACKVVENFLTSIINLKVQEAAGLLLESKMFYVPFLLNSGISTSRTEDSPVGQ